MENNWSLFGSINCWTKFWILSPVQERKELEAKGIWTKCIVIDEKYSRGKIQSWMIKCSYSADNLTFETNYENDEPNIYSTGDTLNLIYSKDFPKIYRLEYEWKTNNNR